MPTDAQQAAAAPGPQYIVSNDLIGITPPNFSWDEPDLPQAFHKFKRYCEILLSTPTYANKTDKVIVSYILLWLGPQGVEIYDSWSLPNDDQNIPTKVWEAFSAYFEPKSNYRLSRYQLRNIRQEDNEPVDSFVRRLKTHSQKCKFPPEHIDDQLIDQFIVGVTHDNVRKKILDQDPSKLTLDNCIQFARTYEATDKQLHCFQDQHAVDSIRRSRQQGKPRQQNTTNPNPSRASAKPCVWCSGPQHRRHMCPARESECDFCHKMGHWEKACIQKQHSSQNQGNKQRPYDNKPSRQQKVYEIQTDEQYDEMNFASIDTTGDGSEAFASVKIKLSDKQVANLHGKIDTGSQGNILPLRTYQQMYPDDGKILQPSSTTLTAYNGTRIKQFGYINIPCRYKNKSATGQFFITDTNAPVIFGLQLCMKLGLVQLNYSIQVQHKAALTSTKQLKEEYPDRFAGLGKLPGTYTIHVKEDAVPRIHAPRRAPIQLREKIEAELQRMIELDVIKSVTVPTDWVSSLTYVTKANGSLRMCLDPSDLNKALKRGQHHIPTMEELAYKFSNAKFFSKLDARSGYWSIVLDDQSQLLTTFNTPFGRYCFKRLPFGLCISQDIFQAAMDDGLRDLPGVVSIADDIAVFGSTEQEHDHNLHTLMQRARQINLVFNPEKCQIKQTEIPFFGNLYTATGMKPDPKKVQAISDLQEPTNQTELQSFLGFITYLAAYIPNMSAHTKPLRSLLQKDIDFQWNHEQSTAFEEIKRLICEANTLTYFDSSKPTTIQVDASQAALGAALTQEGHVIAYASKSLNDTEQRYANIEREMLACVFGAERFHTYVFGKQFTIESDHKPLEIISKKNLTAAPARLQRMLLRLQRYDYSITYRPGKEMILADSLSRLPSNADDSEIDLDVKVCLIQFSTSRLDELRNETREDPVLFEIMEYVINGFPDQRQQMSNATRIYWSFRDEITIDNGILLKAHRVIVPTKLKQSFLKDIHVGHQGVTRCQQRARSTLYWPNIDRDIEQHVQYCDTCQRHQASQPTEQLMPLASELPNIAWHTLGTDLFSLNGDTFLIIADYMSKYPIIERLGRDTTSQAVANITSKYFSLFGAPQSIISDNGPQFIGKPYQQLMNNLDIAHVTSSPHHSRSHGFIERTIRTVKAVMKKESRDTDIALLILRTTPIGPQLPSPAELIFGRPVKSNLPLQVKSPNHEGLREHRERSYHEMTGKFHHSYPELTMDQPVYFQDVAKKHWSPGIIIGYGPEPRSYTVLSEQTGSKLRRNRGLLRQRNTHQHDPVPPPELLPDSLPVAKKQESPMDQLKAPVLTTQPNKSVPATPEKPPPALVPRLPDPLPSPTNTLKPPCAQATSTRSGRVSKPPLRLIEQT